MRHVREALNHSDAFAWANDSSPEAELCGLPSTRGEHGAAKLAFETVASRCALALLVAIKSTLPPFCGRSYH
jgi:hypothetical protein